MPTLVIIFRAVALAAFAGPLLLGLRKTDRDPDRRRRGERLPVVANFAAFGLLFAVVAAFDGSAEGAAALGLALGGCLLALASLAFVLWSGAELGPAWSFVPMADQDTGLVTSGPYRHIRHPIYLGLSLLAMGEAVTFSSWPAVAVVILAIVPTFAWRARVEERLLADTFGERYAHYRKRTKMLIPYCL